MKLPPQVTEYALKAMHFLIKYRVALFVVVVIAVYGHVWLTINTLSSAQPSTDSVSTEVNTVRPAKIDKTIVNQLNLLQDNNVNVKSLFDSARQNPFQECKSQTNSANSDPSC